MKTLSFKAKILLLVLIPLILVSTALTVLAIYQATELGERNLTAFSDKIYDLRRNELKNYTEMALTSVEHIYNSENKDDPKVQEAAKTILRNLAYGSDGYIFVYDYQGTNVVLPTKPHIEGKNLWDIKDKDGVFLIRELVERAQEGGGYTNYVWDKPSKGKEIDKISYSLGLEDWKWMVGTGLYVDDLDDAITGVQTQVDSNITRTWQLIAGLALSCTIIVGLIGARFTASQGQLADEQLQTMSLKVVSGQEEERSRVARELQKAINQKLVHARAKLEKISHSDAVKDPEVRAEFILAAKALNSSIKEVHRISGDLRPEILDKMGLDAAVDALTVKTAADTHIEVSYRHTGTKDRLPLEVETALYRIIQEAFNNIVNHSKADIVSIRIGQKRHHVSISIQDNGQGFNTKEMTGNKGGLGLVDMRIRAESLGGTFTIFSSEGSGTIIKVDVPV